MIKKYCVVCVKYKETVQMPTLFPDYIDWCYVCMSQALAFKNRVEAKLKDA